METNALSEFLSRPTVIWLMAGVVCMAAELAGISGVGFIFAAIGALAAGACLYFSWVADISVVEQFVIFFSATSLSAALLWKPLKKRRLGATHHPYSSIIGQSAYVGSNGITKRVGGEVTWSGTIMQAQLAPNASVERLEAGSQVVISEVMGATLIVLPQP